LRSKKPSSQRFSSHRSRPSPTVTHCRVRANRTHASL